VLTPAQFDEWAEYYALEPWGGEVEDYRHAVACSVAVSAAGGDPDVATFLLGRTDTDTNSAPTPEETAVALAAVFGL